MTETKNKIEFDFLKQRFVALGIFVVLLIAGFVKYQTTGFILGTDFSGGIRIEFSAPTTIEEIRTLIPQEQIAITTLETADGTQTFLLTAPAELEQDGSGDHLLETVRNQYNPEEVIVLSSEYIGPSVGDNFIYQSLNLLSIVIALILVYVAFRFDFIYGVGATCALIHDMIIMLIFTLLFNIPIDLTVLAAFLTILGYSINDTIVIFDRVRENHKILPSEDFTKTINKSINQSMTRTILTSITTLFVAGAIYLWSGNVLRSFGLLLVVGIISGTYSSIFVASPITYVLWKKFHKEKK